MCADVILLTLQEKYTHETGLLYSPTYIVEKSSFGYVVAFDDDIFSCHSTFQLKTSGCLHKSGSESNRHEDVESSDVIAHVVKHDQDLVITAYQDIIFVGLNFSDLTVHVQSTSRVGFVGGCCLHRLTVEGKSLKFCDLSLGYLSATAEEFVTFDGSVHLNSIQVNGNGQNLLQNSKIIDSISKVICGGNVLVRGEIVCLRCSFSITAKSVQCESDISIGSGSLLFTIEHSLSNTCNLCADKDIMIGGLGVFENFGVVEAGGIFILAVDSKIITVNNAPKSRIVALTGDLICVRTNFHNNGLIQGFASIDVVGGSNLLNSPSGSILSQGSLRVQCTVIEQQGHCGSANDLTLTTVKKLENTGDILASHGHVILTCNGGAKGCVNSGRILSMQQSVFVTAARFSNSSVIQAAVGLAFNISGPLMLNQGAVLKSLSKAAIVCDTAVVLGFIETKDECIVTCQRLDVIGTISTGNLCKLVVRGKMHVDGIITSHIINIKCDAVDTSASSQIGAVDTLGISCNNLMAAGIIRAVRCLDITASTERPGKHVINGFVECVESGPEWSCLLCVIADCHWQDRFTPLY